MGVTTPNIGIYVPFAGETNYDSSFAAGMINIDQHDHSGGPNKGVPIQSGGISDGSITYAKLNANVADVSTGIGTSVILPNQLQILGILKNLYQLATSKGFLAKDGSTVSARTLQQTANQISISNADGSGGDPTFSLASTIYTNISFDSGSNTLDAYTTGTYNPDLSFGGGSTGITYTTRFGKYWKIGKVVFFNATFVLSSKGSSTGSASITLPPFSSAGDGIRQACQVQSFLNTYPVGGAVATYIVGEINAGSSSVNLVGCGANCQTSVTDANFANNSEIYLSGFYWTS